MLLAGICLFFGVPLVWLFLAPTKTDGALRAEPPLSFGSWGNIPQAWENLLSFNDGQIVTWLGNSLWYSTASVLIAVLISVPAGYGLAKFHFAGRKAVLFLTLVTMVVPAAAMILPLYLELSAVGLTNTPWAVILPLGFYPFGVYLVYLFATTSIPDSIIEAARIDGASELRIFTTIFLPLSRPSTIMVAFFAFVTCWNAFFLPFIMLTDPAQATIQTGLNLMVRNTNALSGANLTGLIIHEPEVALAALVSISPILVIFLFAQRYLVAGQTLGAEKG